MTPMIALKVQLIMPRTKVTEGGARDGDAKLCCGHRSARAEVGGKLADTAAGRLRTPTSRGVFVYRVGTGETA